MFNAVNLTANYRLIDTWMMGKRFQEEIYTTKKEMVEFINCLKKKRSTLLRNRKCEEEFIKNQKESHLVVISMLCFQYYHRMNDHLFFM